MGLGPGTSGALGVLGVQDKSEGVLVAAMRLQSLNLRSDISGDQIVVAEPGDEALLFRLGWLFMLGHQTTPDYVTRFFTT